MSNAVPQKKTFFQIANKNFIMLFVAYTVICITHSMTNSVTSAGWRLAGMDLTTIGLIASAMSWAAFIIRPFSAPITDRGNKKLIYIAAVGALTLAVFMYSLSMDNSAFAVPAKIIHGVSWTFISTITAVIVSEYVPREDLPWPSTWAMPPCCWSLPPSPPSVWCWCASPPPPKSQRACPASPCSAA